MRRASTPGSQSTVLPERTVSAPASTAATGDPQVLAREAYLGMRQAFVAASRTADYQDPLLDHYAAGSALELLIHPSSGKTRASPVLQGPRRA